MMQELTTEVGTRHATGAALGNTSVADLEVSVDFQLLNSAENPTTRASVS